MKKKAPILFGGFLLAVAGLAGIAGFSLFHYAHSPSGDDKTGKIIEITAGQGFSATTARLVQEGVILSPARFKIIAALSGDDKKIKAGEKIPQKDLEVMKQILFELRERIKRHRAE